MCIDRCIKDVAYSLAHFVEIGLSCEGYQLTDSNEVHASLIKNLEPLVKERLNLPKDQNINQVLSKIFDVEKAKKELIAEGGDYQKRVKRLNSIKIKATRRFNRICAYYYCEKEIILKNLSTIIKSIIATLKDKRYKPFSRSLADIIEWAKLEEEGHEFFDFDDLFERYYQKEINNKESNNESKEVSSEETNNNNDKDQENETNDIESTIEHFAETFNHFINGETFSHGSGTCRRSGRYLPLLEVFGSKYVRALEPLIRERMRLPENKGISRVVDRLNLDLNLLFEKLNSHYLRYTPGASLKCAETRFLEAKRNVTKLFNRLCYFSFDIYVERSEVIEEIRENLETIINAIAACVEDSRYNKFGYDFMDLFRYYYKKEINNKESNNEPKEVSSERTNNNNDKDQENENEDNNTIENPWLFIIRNAKAPEVEV